MLSQATKQETQRAGRWATSSKFNIHAGEELLLVDQSRSPVTHRLLVECTFVLIYHWTIPFPIFLDIWRVECHSRVQLYFERVSKISDRVTHKRNSKINLEKTEMSRRASPIVSRAVDQCAPAFDPLNHNMTCTLRINTKM